MSVTVEYTSFHDVMQAKFEQCLYNYLEQGAAEIESAAIQNTPIGDTYKLRSSWRHEVGEREAKIGNDAEHSIWLEMGTGEYAINGDGRKGEWSYRDANGVWHTTTGNKPHRMLENAWNEKIRLVKDVILPAAFKEMSG